MVRRTGVSIRTELARLARQTDDELVVVDRFNEILASVEERNAGRPRTVARPSTPSAA
jgi:hypothetical protein